MSSDRSSSPPEHRGGEKLDFVQYLKDLSTGISNLRDETRARLHGLIEERDRFRQWEGVLDLLLQLEREGTFRFLGKDNSEKRTLYRFADARSRTTVVLPAPPVSLRTVDAHGTGTLLAYPFPMPTSAAALADSVRRLCRREVLDRHLATMVVIRLEGDEASVVGAAACGPYDGRPRFLPEYVDEHVLGHGRCVLVSDLRGDPLLEDHPLVPACGSVGVFPMKTEAGTSALGLLEFWRAAPGEFSAETARFLMTFAQFLGGLVANVRHLEGLIFLDAVTGIFNRKYFDDVLLRREVARADRTKQKLALLMMDVDNFKAINDACGHQVGDEVLRKVASLMRDRLRPLVDSVARHGGDEFVVLLPGMSNVEAARRVGERLLSAVADSDFSRFSARMPGPVTLSIGGVVYGGGAESRRRAMDEIRKQLESRADEALYQVKEAGRNGVFVCEEEIA